MRLLGRPAVGRLSRQPCALQVDVPNRGLQPIIVLGDGRGREGVGLGDIRAGGEVLVVQVCDDVRPGQAQDVVVALHLAWVVLEPVAAVVGFGQAPLLEHHAPGSVEDQHALLGGGLQRLDAILPGHAAASWWGV